MRRTVPLHLSLLLALAACEAPATPATCTAGLDLDADGVCDGDRVDWSEDASIDPGTSRANVYELDPADLAEVSERGIQHAFVWPVEITGLLIPYRPFQAFMDNPDNAGAVSLLREQLGFGTFEEFYTWLGLARYPEPGMGGIYDLPIPEGHAPGDAVGASLLQTEWGEGLTFSCATCHASPLFGRTVVGLSNRRARANAVFLLAGELVHNMPPDAFQSLTDATAEERALYERTLDNYGAVGAKEPEVLGLDTAVAQIGLSLGRRADDPWATYSAEAETDPDFVELETFVADSKPAVWWSLKYKTRWLSDGSLVSGNPIVYNLLANELGRGTDLHELSDWLATERTTLDELTVAVFATEPPKWTDFFGTDGIDEAEARAGQVVFDANCASCHGEYEKGWDAADADTLSAVDRLATTRVVYLAQTPVMDMGTDPQRAQGHGYVDRLNQLQISLDAENVFVGQAGYVPPPLEGIWARYPYLHNNSVPTLCALLSPPEERPTVFYQGPADDPATDFDADCVGYPVGDAIPVVWLEDEEARFDTTVPGLRNIGHEQDLDATERAQVIAFLKTL
ncbi:MAG: c-type cytochrome [Pseudomonadota bacterium]|nr:c-type cytochrome [Pseudomonadota bacterium]